MHKLFSTGYLLLLLLLPGSWAGAQETGSLYRQGDSLMAIKQWVTKDLLQQLQQSTGWKKNQPSKLSTLLKDSAAIDTLSRFYLAQLQRLGNTGMRSAQTVLVATAANSKEELKQQFTQLMQTQQAAAVFNQVWTMLHQPLIQWKQGDISLRGQYAPSLSDNGQVFMNSLMLNSSWAVQGIPMALRFSRQDYTGPDYRSRNIISFSFDREAWLRSLRDKIKLTLKPSDLLPDCNAALLTIKESMLATLKSSLDSVNTVYKGWLGEQLLQLGGPEQILKGDIRVLRDKLLSPEWLQQIEDKKNQLAILQQQINTGGRPNMALYDSLLKSVHSIAGINEMINKIVSFKEAIGKSGLLEKLQEAEQYKNNSLQQWLQEPDKLRSLAKEQLNLNGIQKMFLNIHQLQIGMNTISISPLSIYQYTNNGINAAFVNNNTYLFVMAGKQKEFSNLYDYRFAGTSFSTDNTSIGIRVGRGDLHSSHAHFSLFSYKQQKSNYGNHLVSVLPGKTIVATFSNQLKINDLNFLNLEVSTSTHTYDHQKNMSDNLLQGSNNGRPLPRGENILQQLACTLQWNGEIKDRQLSYDIHGTRIGRAYTNPGSFFLSSGMTELGGSIKKSLLKSRLQLSARGNYREYAYGTGSSRWRNYNLSVQSRWKLKKGQWIALRYQPCQSLRLQDDRKASPGESNRLSLDLNIRRSWGKLHYQQVIGLAAVKNNYHFDSVLVNNRSAMLSSLQTFAINKNSYYLNMQYNSANSAAAVAAFNTQVNLEAGIVYTIGKHISASAALNYNSTKDWFKQVGIRQGISGQLGDKLTINIYADISRNIKVYRPCDMDNIRLDWSLQYLLK